MTETAKCFNCGAEFDPAIYPEDLAPEFCNATCETEFWAVTAGVLFNTEEK